MIVIEIFEENHRFSEQTPHPASIYFVGAVTSAASLQASVGRVATQPRRAASEDTSTRRMRNGTNTGT
jgi:hypothetical protein